MPEWPEVTQCRDKLEPLLVGSNLLELSWDKDGRSWRNISTFNVSQWLKIGEPKVISLHNHSKYLEIYTHVGILLFHFKFTGWLQTDFGNTLPRQFIHPTNNDPTKYARWCIKTTRGNLYFTDPRALGVVYFFKGMNDFIANSPTRLLGPVLATHDLDATMQDSIKRFRNEGLLGRRRIDAYICDALIDQHRFSGVGNYLRCEILAEVGMWPWETLGSLSDDQLFDVLKNAQKVMLHAYKAESHEWWRVFRVKLCRRCGGKIIRYPWKNRGIYFCGKCQRSRHEDSLQLGNPSSV